MTQISALHLTEAQGMELFEKANIQLCRKTYYTLKGKVLALTKRRLIDVAKELPEEHLKSLDLIKLMEQKLIIKMITTDDDVSLVRFVKIITEIQPYKSAYQLDAKFALQELQKRESEQKNHTLPILV